MKGTTNTYCIMQLMPKIVGKWGVFAAFSLKISDWVEVVLILNDFDSKATDAASWTLCRWCPLQTSEQHSWGRLFQTSHKLQMMLGSFSEHVEYRHWVEKVSADNIFLDFLAELDHFLAVSDWDHSKKIIFRPFFLTNLIFGWSQNLGPHPTKLLLGKWPQNEHFCLSKLKK